MAKKKNLLHKTEKLILILFNKSNVPLSTNEIATKLEISYTTAKKYLESLEKKELIRRREYGK